ncbi:hypothetical protein D9619_004856 [Psilocybe cf. subviscida]|uniref:Ornithine cyclodeaminase n=1 Tax=Psilocybe cf. subviscida TaxID=2480587 RepID=A0A8H5F8Y0_9AGAR|nr:hypothetical protein D9619_004856 [Psilocybe cf. subviscida]
MSLLVLSGADVDGVAASMTPDQLQLLMAQVFAGLSASSKARSGVINIHMPPRIILPTENHTALFMPARIGRVPATTSDSAVTNDEGSDMSIIGTAVKVVCVPNESDPRGLPGTTLVLDEVTGAVKAVVNARKLTALRNAAGSLLSTTLVGPTEPRNIVAFGAGQQIEAHIDMHLRHLATLSRCTIVNRTINARATALVERLRAKHGSRAAEFSLIPSTSGSARNTTTREGVEDAVRAADIIVCATSSTEPLFPSAWVRNGTHVILIGSYKPIMHEIDTALVRRALPTSTPSSHETSRRIPILLVDSREDCLKEAGELITAGTRSDHVTEIGELLPTTAEGSLSVAQYHDIVSSGKRGLRSHVDLPEGFDGPVTMFKSVGIGLQDVAIASAVVNKALSLGNHAVGTVVADYDA